MMPLVLMSGYCSMTGSPTPSAAAGGRQYVEAAGRVVEVGAVLQVAGSYNTYLMVGRLRYMVDS